MGQVELETHPIEDNVQNAESSNLGDQEHHGLATNKPRRTIRPPTRYGFEDLFSYALIINIEDHTPF